MIPVRKNLRKMTDKSMGFYKKLYENILNCNNRYFCILRFVSSQPQHMVYKITHSWLLTIPNNEAT